MEEEIEYTVQYTVTFESKVTCKRSELPDMVANINIPEDEGSTYCSDSFFVENIVDQNEEPIFEDGKFLDEDDDEQDEDEQD